MTIASSIAHEPIKTSYKPPRDAGASKDSGSQQDFDDVVTRLKTPPAADKGGSVSSAEVAGDVPPDGAVLQDVSTPASTQSKDAAGGVLQQAGRIFEALGRDLDLSTPPAHVKAYVSKAGVEGGAKVSSLELDDLLTAAALTPEVEVTAELQLEPESDGADAAEPQDALPGQAVTAGVTAEALAGSQVTASPAPTVQPPAKQPVLDETAEVPKKSDAAARETSATKFAHHSTAAAEGDDETADLSLPDDDVADVISSRPSDRGSDRTTGRGIRAVVSDPVAPDAQSQAQPGFDGGRESADGEEAGKPIDVSSITRQTHLAPVGAGTQTFESVVDQIATRIAGDVPPPEGAQPAARAPVADIERPAVRHFAAAGTETLNITLKPEQLGTVHIHLKLTDKASLELRIEADTPQAVAAIKDDTDALIARLGAAGYDIDRVVVQSSPIDRALNDSTGGDVGRQQGRENLEQRQQGSDGGSQQRRAGSDEFGQGPNGDGYAARDQTDGSRRAGAGIFV